MGDAIFANDALSQLSYSPTVWEGTQRFYQCSPAWPMSTVALGRMTFPFPPASRYSLCPVLLEGIHGYSCQT
jgi:hypothetical protein